MEAAPEGGARPMVRASVELSGYSDSDAVRVASPTVAGSVADDVRGWSIGGRYLVDAVSAASVDVVATASRRWFEYRHVGSGAASYRRGDGSVSLSGGVSREPDYLSIGAGGTLAVDTRDRTVTPSLGFSYEHDDVGRTGMPRDRWQSMWKAGVQGGLTFVANPSTIMGVTADAFFERGYLAKPYRFVPLFAPGVATAVPPGASVDQVNFLRLSQRPADALPEARDRYALTARLAHRFDASTLRLDQRLYTDSWGLRGSTTDARFMADVMGAGSRLMLGPHFRYHVQGAISFWQRAYEATLGPEGILGVPRYRTGDRELGSLHTVTAGGVMRLRLTRGSRDPWSLMFQIEGIFTRYDDALYLTRRRALFSAMALESQWD